MRRKIKAFQIMTHSLKGISSGLPKIVIIPSLFNLDGRRVRLRSSLLVQWILSLYFLLNLLKVQMSNLGFLSVENLGQFLKSRASGFHIHEVDKEEFDKDPDLW